MIFLDAPVFWLVMLVAFGMGSAGIPMLIYLLAPSIPAGLRGVVGRIIFTIGTIVNGRSVLVLREDGQYDIVPAEQRNGDEVVDLDGDERVIAGPSDYVSRLGLRPFGVAADKSLRWYDEITADTDEVAVTDGSGQKSERGGFEVMEQSGPGTGWLQASYVRLWQKMQGAGGTEIVDQGETVGLRKYGGGSDNSTIIILVLALVALLSGVATGMLVLGV